MRKIEPGMLGWSVANIEEGKRGYAWFPVGEPDPAFIYGRRMEQVQVRAREDIRARVTVVVIDEGDGIRESGPIESTDLGYKYDDYKALAFTNTEVQYDIGAEAWSAARDNPERFVGEIVFLKADQDCKVRFNGKTRVQHFLEANIQYEYRRRTRSLHVIRDTNSGTLVIRALGSVVGVP